MKEHKRLWREELACNGKQSGDKLVRIFASASPTCRLDTLRRLQETSPLRHVRVEGRIAVARLAVVVAALENRSWRPDGTKRICRRHWHADTVLERGRRDKRGRGNSITSFLLAC